MSEVIISEYRPEYAEDVISMILEIQQNEFSLPITIENQPDLLDIENFYQKRGCFFVALWENEVVGTIALIGTREGDGALRKMFVKKDFRGKGVSKSLLSTLINWAKEHDFKKIYLGTTPQFLAAHRFYEKNDFVKIEKDQLPKSFPVMEVDKLFYFYELE